MSLDMAVGLGPGNFVLDGEAAPPPKKRGEPPTQFSDRVYCGQMAGWIKVLLGTEIGLGHGEVVLDGDPASPVFGPCLLGPNGWMD